MTFTVRILTFSHSYFGISEYVPSMYQVRTKYSLVHTGKNLQSFDIASIIKYVLSWHRAAIGMYSGIVRNHLELHVPGTYLLAPHCTSL